MNNEEARDMSDYGNDIIKLPPVQMGSPRVAINSDKLRATNVVLSEQILPNDTVPIVTIVSSTSDSEAEPLEQLSTAS